jgi:hypothetical protein
MQKAQVVAALGQQWLQRVFFAPSKSCGVSWGFDQESEGELCLL